MDAPDNQNLALKLDLTMSFCHQFAFTRGDSARLQRATKGARQSAGGRGDDVIQRRRLRAVNVAVDPVVLGYL